MNLPPRERNTRGSDRDAKATLVVALLEAAFETPLFGTFLDRLRDVTGADYATLNFRPPGRSFHEMVHLMSGKASARIAQTFHEHVPLSDPPVALSSLVEGRPYSLRELLRLGDQRLLRLHREILQPAGITDVRKVRVREASGVNAWLSIVRRGRDFEVRDSALLRSMAPLLRGVLRFHVALERMRFAASVTAEAVRPLQFGWFTLDRSGHVLDCDTQGAHVLARSGVLSKGSRGNLVARPAKVERGILRAVAELADRPTARPRTITLRNDPWLDMLLVPARHTSISTTGDPAVIAYVHGDSWRSADRWEQLAELFTLTASEARIALALCRGMTIEEAAAGFGLSVATVRSYTKSIFAKTGARGQTDLVRFVMRSVLAIVPEREPGAAATTTG